jgi:hypothetical protein
MSSLTRMAFAMAVLVAPVLGAQAAYAADPGTLFTCPSTLAGLPLTGQDANATQLDPWFGEHGASFFCDYQRDNDRTLGDVRLSAGVIWEESAVSPETFYCDGNGRAMNDVGSNGEMIASLSTDRRAISLANQSTDYGGSHATPIQPAVDLAAEMLPLAEARAAVCPGVSEGGNAPAGGISNGATGATGHTWTEAAPADAGGSDGPGAPLVAGGLIAAVLGGAGSLLLTKQGAGILDVALPADKLFSGQEALDLLHNAGLIEPVLDAAGRPVGYTPIGDLQQMLDAASPWQPAFANPVATPDGGTATHLSGIAFEPGPDGTMTSITVAVRPGGVPAPAGGPAPAAAAPAADRPPGLSLGDQLWLAGMEAAVRGIPLEAVLDGPIAPPGPPSLADSIYISSIPGSAEYLGVDGPIGAVTRSAPAAPATAPTPTRPPVDPGQFERWLTTPGPKAITTADLHALAPNSLDANGVVKSGLYKGGRVTSTIADGLVDVMVHAPDSTDSILDIVLPDIQVGGTLSTNGGRLVVDVQGQPSDSVIAKAVQKQLDGLNAKLSGAGMAVDHVHVTDGAINVNIVRPT